MLDVEHQQSKDAEACFRCLRRRRSAMTLVGFD